MRQRVDLAHAANKPSAVAEAARRTTRRAAESMIEGIEAGRSLLHAAEQTPWRLGHGMTLEMAGANRSALDAAETYANAAQKTAADVHALSQLPSIVLSGVAELREIGADWFRRAVRNATEATQTLFRCSTLQEVAEVQARLVGEQAAGLLDGSAEFLRIAARLSEEALRPIEARRRARPAIA